MTLTKGIFSGLQVATHQITCKKQESSTGNEAEKLIREKPFSYDAIQQVN